MSYYSALEVTANARQLVDMYFSEALDEHAYMCMHCDDGPDDRAYARADYLASAIFKGYNKGGALDALRVTEDYIYDAITEKYYM